MNMDKHPLQDLFEDHAGYDTVSYWPRSCDEECLAVELGDKTVGEMIADVISNLERFRDDDDEPAFQAVADAFRRMKSDNARGSMGIVYFPGIPYVKDEAP